MPSPLDIAQRFDLGGNALAAAPYGHGLINDTFFVEVHRPGTAAVLQRISRRAFPQPERVMENLRTLLDHLDASPATTHALRLPRIRRARDGRDFVVDTDGGFWRALDFIDNTYTPAALTGPGPAREVGLGLGRFHTAMAGLDPARLHVTRPGFHNTPLYLARCEEAASTGAPKDCAAFVAARRDGVAVLEDARRDGKVAARPIHGDPKLDNFLFDRSTGRVVSLIDLDTVQPGLVHYDLGDCLRSSCNPAGESPRDVAEVRFDLELARAILSGYLAEARFLTAQDFTLLYDAIRLIPLELGLRFLTDHLEGDRYFKVTHRGHNLHRARVQFALVAAIERAEGEIRGLLDELRSG
jgi:Ser/Thr protein kinase RdoA (MazF antagonist)